MAKKVKELIKGYEGTNDLMSLSEFRFCIKEVGAHLVMSERHQDESPASKAHMKIAADIISVVSEHFNDNGNLVNWFFGKPCSFIHPLTGRKKEVKVRDDYEAIYLFLRYCMQINRHESIDEDFSDYLEYILREPADI